MAERALAIAAWAMRSALALRRASVAWFVAGAPMGVVSVVAYDLAAVRRCAVYGGGRCTALALRCLDAATGGGWRAAALDRALVHGCPRGPSVVYELCVALAGGSVRRIVSRSLDAASPPAPRESIASLVAPGHHDLTATYGRCGEALGPGELLTLAFLEGRMSAVQAVRLLARAPCLRVAVTDLETMETVAHVVSPTT